MKTTAMMVLLFCLACPSVQSQTSRSGQDLFGYAQSRKNDLQLSVYATAHFIQEFFTTEEGRREILSVLKCNGITKVYLEVYRAGLVITPELLEKSSRFLKDNGFEVVGGIATVPGENFAMKQEGPLTWCNWQNKKTQDDFREVMKNSAPLFDTFVIDDFLCTADTSMESKNAKGARSWSVYRRALLTQLAEDVFIKPAKKANPAIKMIIKYPQWYDRFHLFGYDVETGPKLFDQVWVGTETRGQYTQRYGFVQPYEGFVNYRWIASLAGEKIGAAWFDYGDCNADDFVEQAYQSVLSGARELVLFSMNEMVLGHPGLHLLRLKFEALANLSVAVSKNPVMGTVAYKPAQSDAGGDLYLMDGIGMFGVSLIPASQYPADARVILLPTQAAADRDILRKIEASLKNGTRIVMTAGFLANSASGEKIAKLAGIKWPVLIQPSESPEIFMGNNPVTLKIPLKLESPLIPDGSTALLEAKTGTGRIPFLLKNSASNIYVLNVHTFSESDFAAVGEVLLSPRQLGLYELPKEWANTLRSAMQTGKLPVMDAPTRVAMQQLKDGSFVVHNYNQEAVTVKLKLLAANGLKDRFTGKALEVKGQQLEINMGPRSRVWIGD
ncbi:MAG TPA: hypothetical protein VN249_05485 [Prolixibacteraceae bacterium]|nr:hypothetical protein [Prolixibacteraceae bacterium]